MITDDPSRSFHLALLVAAWLGYFVLHSLLASLAVKRSTAAPRPDWMPLYRLGFLGQGHESETVTVGMRASISYSVKCLAI